MRAVTKAELARRPEAARKARPREGATSACLGQELSDALEQQTATGEILQVISSSPSDAQPVFDAIVESVVRLCDGISATVYRFDGDLIHLVAHHHTVTAAALE